jgi:hypothetical protein
MIKCVASRGFFGAVPTPARFSAAVPSCALACGSFRVKCQMRIIPKFDVLDRSFRVEYVKKGSDHTHCNEFGHI